MRYHAVIIGSGAGGGPLALRLSQAGLKVLVLEKGPKLEHSDYTHDELAIEGGLFSHNLDECPHTVVTKRTKKPVKSILGWTASCVGGATEHMGAYLYRFHPVDFNMASEFKGQTEFADWPFSYQDLEPYYCEAEWEVGVSGLAGSNPFEGHRSKAYPLAPLQAHPVASSLEEVCAAHGVTAFPTPRAINSAGYLGRPKCLYCECCAGYGCPNGARGSAQSALLARAIATGNCRVEANAMVHTVTVNKQNRASGCVYWQADGREIEICAPLVCVCCSAVESARLLLLSKSPRFPDGLANNNGMVGRHLQFHALTMGEGRFTEGRGPSSILNNRHPFLGRSVMDYYRLPKAVAELNKGGVLRFGFTPRTPIATARRVIAQSNGLVWGEGLKQAIRNRFHSERNIYFEVFHDFFPTKDTFMRLDNDTRDKWGLPVAQISLDLHPHHKIAGQWLGNKAADVLHDLGSETVTFSDVGGTSSYLVMGTCRAGVNSKISVLDSNCQSHEVANLYVVDGSFMPSSGGPPPTLTILANSFRVAHHLKKGLTLPGKLIKCFASGDAISK